MRKHTLLFFAAVIVVSLFVNLPRRSTDASLTASRVEASSEVSAWCEWTNGFLPEQSRTCFRRQWRGCASSRPLLHLVVTAMASDVDNDSLDWIGELPYSTTVYVKPDVCRFANRTSRRAFGFRASLKTLPALKLPPLATAATVTVRDVHTAADHIMRHYSRAWDPQRVHNCAEPRNASFRSRLAHRLNAMRVAHFGPGYACEVEIAYSDRNVGDEASSIATHLLRLRNATGRETVPHFTAFVHGHRESWHSLDVVQQLACMCVGPQTRYVTLTSPSRAFLYGCQDYGGVAQLAQRGDCNATLWNGSGGGELAAFTARKTAREMGVALNHARAMRELLGPTPIRNSVARDCCTTFIVSRQALLDLPTDLLQRLGKTLVNQPARAHALPCSSSADGVEFEELSMYAERLWRGLFVPSAADTQRDLTTVGCGRRVSLGERRRRRLELAGCDGHLLPESAVDTSCAPQAQLNRYDGGD
jgi:hypothetical protein